MKKQLIVIKNCPMCGEKNFVLLDEEEAKGFRDYREGGKLIQNCLPNNDLAVLEFVRDNSGYCSKCQKMLFGKGSKRILKYSDKNYHKVVSQIKENGKDFDIFF